MRLLRLGELCWGRGGGDEEGGGVDGAGSLAYVNIGRREVSEVLLASPTVLRYRTNSMVLWWVLLTCVQSVGASEEGGSTRFPLFFCFFVFVAITTVVSASSARAWAQAGLRRDHSRGGFCVSAPSVNIFELGKLRYKKDASYDMIVGIID